MTRIIQGLILKWAIITSMSVVCIATLLYTTYSVALTLELNLPLVVRAPVWVGLLLAGGLNVWWYFTWKYELRYL